jgi:hypothetical protein
VTDNHKGRKEQTDMPDILHKVGIKSSSLKGAYDALTTPAPNEIKIDSWE